MDWRKITINALTGLAVAVISGILVWALTTEPASREGVFYEIENAGSFGSGNDELSFYKVFVKNNGDKKSKHLTFRLAPREFSKIKQSEIKSSISQPKILNKFSNPVSLTFSVPELLPTEFVSVYVVLSGKGKEPLVIIKTENSIVKRIKKNPDGQSYYSRYKLFIILFSFGLFPLLARYGLRYLYATGSFGFSSKSKNNSGFLLFHSGLIHLAEEILESAIKDGDYSPFELSNLAAIKTFLNKNDEAVRLINSAYYWAKSKNEVGIVNFNRFMISAYQTDFDQALLHLKNAKIGGYQTEKYIQSSSILKSIFDIHPEFLISVKNIVKINSQTELA